ncbi:MAG: hypothetical protein ACOCXZ_01670 [Chloroflexota bacterium]
MPDIVGHQTSGYLARPFDAADLARGIVWVLEDKARYTQLRAAARHRAVTTFDAPIVARQYIDLYHRMLAN